LAICIIAVRYHCRSELLPIFISGIRNHHTRGLARNERRAQPSGFAKGQRAETQTMNGTVFTDVSGNDRRLSFSDQISVLIDGVTPLRLRTKHSAERTELN